MSAKIESAGIIAAGEGSRLKKHGISTHKPMVPVAGFPLIGHTLKNLESVGIKKVTIIFNETEEECALWVRKNFAGLEMKIIVKSTPSSFESFWLVGQALGPGRHLISTVDAFCLPSELKKMVKESPEEGIALGVTSFVDDEKPLWVEMDETSRRISGLGGTSGKYATAGFYNVPGEIFQKRPDPDVASLRFFLKWLVQNGVPAFGVVLSKVVDIDLPKDIRMAEELLKAAHG